MNSYSFTQNKLHPNELKSGWHHFRCFCSAELTVRHPSPSNTAVFTTEHDQYDNEHQSDKASNTDQNIQKQTSVMTSCLIGIVPTVVLPVAYLILVDAFPVQAFKLSRTRLIAMMTFASDFIRAVCTVFVSIADEVFANTLAVLAFELPWAGSVPGSAISFVWSVMAVLVSIADDIFINALSATTFELSATFGPVEQVCVKKMRETNIWFFKRTSLNTEDANRCWFQLLFHVLGPNMSLPI